MEVYVLKDKNAIKSRTKLVFIIDSIFPSQSGGREALLYEYCKRLHNRYDITIISMKSKRKEFYPLSKLDVKLYRLPAFGIPFMRGSLWSYLTSLFSFAIITTVFVFVIFFSEKRRLILITAGAGHLYLPLFLMRKEKFKRVVWTHGILVEAFGQPYLKLFFKTLQNFVCRDAHLVLTTGYSNYEYFKPISSHIDILPNGVDLQRFIEYQKEPSTRRNLKTITTVANLDPIRGIPELIKSIPVIRKRYSGTFQVVIVGGGDPEPYLRLANDLGVDRFVKFIGEQKQEDVAKILCQSGIAACLQNPHTFGTAISVVLIESMAAGCAVIAWDSEQYRQVIEHGYSGYLVPLGDSEGLGKGLAELLSNEELVQKLGGNAFKEAKKYDFDRLVNKFESIIDGLYENVQGSERED